MNETDYDEGYTKGQIGLLGSILYQIEHDISHYVDIAAGCRGKGAKCTQWFLEGKICALTDLQERLKKAHETKLDRQSKLWNYKL